MSGLRSAAAAAAKATDTAQSLTFARQALAKRGTYNAVIARAYGIKDGAGPAVAAATVAPQDATVTAGPVSASTQSAQGPAAQASEPARGSNEPATDAQKRSLRSVIDSAKDVSKQVIRLGDRDKDKEGSGTRENNADTAKGL